MLTSEKIEIKYPLKNVKDDLRELLNCRAKLLKKKLTNEPLSTMILLLVLLCRVITREELFYYLGYHRELCTAIDRLTRKSMLESVSLSIEKKNRSYETIADSRSTKALLLSPMGYDIVNAYIEPVHLFQNEINNNKSIMQKYSEGMNILSVLCNKYMPAITDLCYGEIYGVVQPPLYVDTAITTVGGKKYLIMVDILQNSISDLLTKLDQYKLNSQSGFGYGGARFTSVIFSIRRPYCKIAPLGHEKQDYRYDLNRLETALNQMNTYSVTEPYESLHQTLDIIKGSDDHDIYEYLYPLYTDLCNHGYRDLTESYYCFQKHAEDVKHHDSIIYHTEFNSIQLASTIDRRNQLIEHILEDSIENWSILLERKLTISCFPTQLLSHYMPFIDYECSSVRPTIENTLMNDIDRFSMDSYHSTGQLDSTYSKWSYSGNDITRIHLANYYRTEKANVFIETLSYDLGSAIRLKATIKCIHGMPHDNFIVICLVFNHEDALYFAQKLHTYSADFRILFLDTATMFYRADNLENIFTHLNQSDYEYNTHNETWDISITLGKLYEIDSDGRQWYLDSHLHRLKQD